MEDIELFKHRCILYKSRATPTSAKQLYRRAGIYYFLLRKGLSKFLTFFLAKALQYLRLVVPKLSDISAYTDRKGREV